MAWVSACRSAVPSWRRTADVSRSAGIRIEARPLNSSCQLHDREQVRQPSIRHQASMLTDPAVFVVDDDPSVRTAISRLLVSVGLPVQAFGSADEFLAALGCSPAG